jgi:hypothetical protein
MKNYSDRIQDPIKPEQLIDKKRQLREDILLMLNTIIGLIILFKIL